MSLVFASGKMAEMGDPNGDSDTYPTKLHHQTAIRGLLDQERAMNEEMVTEIDYQDAKMRFLHEDTKKLLDDIQLGTVKCNHALLSCFASWICLRIVIFSVKEAGRENPEPSVQTKIYGPESDSCANLWGPNYKHLHGCWDERHQDTGCSFAPPTVYMIYLEGEKPRYDVLVYSGTPNAEKAIFKHCILDELRSWTGHACYREHERRNYVMYYKKLRQ